MLGRNNLAKYFAHFQEDNFSPHFLLSSWPQILSSPAETHSDEVYTFFSHLFFYSLGLRTFTAQICFLRAKSSF